MWSKSLKKDQKQALHKNYLPKINHFITELLIILEADLIEVKIKSQAEISRDTWQILILEKKTIIEMIEKLVSLIIKIDKSLQQTKIESWEDSMLEEDKKIIADFISKISAKNSHE